MFDITCVKTKAGHVGQVTYGGNILWESEPFESEMVPRLDDRLLRNEDVGVNQAYEAAREKVASVVEGLFA